MVSPTCGIQKIQQTSEYNKKEVSRIYTTNPRLPMGGGENNVENNLCTKGERAGGIHWETDITYTTIYKIITNEYLLHSTRNSAQYSVMTCMEKESKTEWICVFVQPIHFCGIAETYMVNQLNSNKIKVFHPKKLYTQFKFKKFTEFL